MRSDLGKAALFLGGTIIAVALCAGPIMIGNLLAGSNGLTGGAGVLVGVLALGLPVLGFFLWARFLERWEADRGIASLGFSPLDGSFGSTASVYRRLVVALARSPGVAPLGAAPDHCLFSTPRGEVLLVVRHGGRPAPGLIEALIARVTKGTVSAVVIGGTATVRAELQALQPVDMTRRKVAVHHLAEDGTWWSGPHSQPSRDLRAALEEVQGDDLAPSESQFDAFLADLTTRARTDAETVRAVSSELEARGRPATLSILAVLILFFGLQYLWGGHDSVALAVRMGAVLGSESPWAEPWRLIAYSFLHGGIWHVGFGVLIIFSLGSVVERLLGSGRFLLLYTASALGGGVAAALFGGGSVTLGSSGALWGLMTGAWVLSRKPGDLLPPAMAAPLQRSLGQTLLLNLAISFAPGISMAGHLGGGVVGGALMAAMLAARERAGSKSSPALGWAAACTAALVGSLGLALNTGTPWMLADDAVVLVNTSTLGITVAVPAYLDVGDEFRVGGPIEGLEELAGATRHEAGDLLRDGIVIDVRNLPRSVADGSDENLVKILVTDVEEAMTAQGWTLRGRDEPRPLAMGTAHIRPFTASNGARLWRLVVIRPLRVAIVEVVRLPEAPAAALRVEAATMNALK
jgi:membrane associated rhomboid family serine protease